ncbi:MAG: DUF928 domain-containing protein [Cyanothece sp. SIO1E1]|nr:DUF928 domain-containing protein [Cyanothece sp. SIO1E1]
MTLPLLTSGSYLKKFGLAIAPLCVLTASLMPALPGSSLEFPKTSNRGAPARTAGGGIRGNGCGSQGPISLTALMPFSNVNTLVGNQATLFIYVPEVQDQSAEIFVRDSETEQAVYVQQISLINTPGVIQIDLPETNAFGAPLLAANRNYLWEFAIVCDPQDRTRDRLVWGFLQRLQPSQRLSQDLTQAADDLQKQAELYAAAGIWQETLAIAAQLQDTQPNLWQELLTSVDLEEMIQADLVECCTPAAYQANQR